MRKMGKQKARADEVSKRGKDSRLLVALQSLGRYFKERVTSTSDPNEMYTQGPAHDPTEKLRKPYRYPGTEE